MTSDSTPPPARPVLDILFDIRSVIGGLFLVYGVVCLVFGLVSYTAADAAKTGGVNLNLWTGIGMLVLGAGFVVWALRKPLNPVEAAADAASAERSAEEGR